MIWWSLAPWIIGALFIGGMSLVVYATWQMLGDKDRSKSWDMQ